MADPQPVDRPTAEPITALLADRVRRFRERCGMSQADLAERMTELGTPWKRATVVNLEKRGTISRQRVPTAGRDAITVQELLRLAVALDVPPVWLLADPKSGTPVPIARGVEPDPWTALLWMTGKQHIEPSKPASGQWAEAQELLDYAYQLASIVEQYVSISQHRERVELMLPQRVADENEREHHDRADRTILTKLPKLLQSLMQRGVALPRLPDDVVKRAAELDIELFSEDG